MEKSEKIHSNTKHKIQSVLYEHLSVHNDAIAYCTLSMSLLNIVHFLQMRSTVNFVKTFST